EITRVEIRVHRCREPNESAPDAFAERETELELCRRLVDLVDDECVGREDVALLEPASRDAGRYDDDVPRRGLGRRFALAVDNADLERRGLEDLFGDRPNRERLARAGTGNDAEPLLRPSELADASAVALFEKCLDVQSDGELDGLTRRARRRDDDHAPGRRLGFDERLVIGKVRLANR